MKVSTMQELQKDWRNLANSKARARRRVNEQVDELNAQAQELLERARKLDADFELEWRDKKAQLRVERDEAVKRELRKGTSAQQILRELNSQNTVWIYALAKEVKAERPEERKAKLQTAEVDVANETSKEAESTEPVGGQIEGVEWLHHDHEGVHRWLVSDDAEHNYIKKYGVEGTPFDGEWFVCDRDHNFVFGSKQLFEATPAREITSRSNMLIDLLDGNYKGRIKLSPNQWRS